LGHLDVSTIVTISILVVHVPPLLGAPPRPVLARLMVEANTHSQHTELFFLLPSKAPTENTPPRVRFLVEISCRCNTAVLLGYRTKRDCHLEESGGTNAAARLL